MNFISVSIFYLVSVCLNVATKAVLDGLVGSNLSFEVRVVLAASSVWRLWFCFLSQRWGDFELSGLCNDNIIARWWTPAEKVLSRRHCLLRVLFKPQRLERSSRCRCFHWWGEQLCNGLAHDCYLASSLEFLAIEQFWNALFCAYGRGYNDWNALFWVDMHESILGNLGLLLVGLI